MGVTGHYKHLNITRCVRGAKVKSSEFRRIRVSMKLTQVELAEKLGCQQPHISDIERGIVGVSRGMQARLLHLRNQKEFGRAK